MLGASAHRGLDIPGEGPLSGSDASVKISRVLASETTAFGPVDEGE